MGPLQRYRRELCGADFHPDPAQQRTVEHLQRLYDALCAAASAPPPAFAERLLAHWRKPPATPITGCYLWGGVGRGKTYLMDMFYTSLPFTAKHRVHFHRFMQGVHAELQTLHGEADPLAIIAQRASTRMRVLCFDEFFVADIGDAMILAGLLRGLFGHGVSLVATSNTPPDELYRDGLQRDRFVPAIELIKAHTEVVHVDGAVDYRLQYLGTADTYRIPANADAERYLAACFERLGGAGHAGATELLGRRIPSRGQTTGVAWFDFDALCRGPRSKVDYIELARTLHTVLLSGVPRLSEADDDAARRFIDLIDVFYDRNVNLILSAAAPPAALYEGTRLAGPFRRTASRLLEMQSNHYLAREHRP